MSDADRLLLRDRLIGDWAIFIRLPLSDDVMDRAALIAHQLRIRGADAVHLAAVLHLQLSDSTETALLVSSDREMIMAAVQLNVRTEDPVTRQRW